MSETASGNRLAAPPSQSPRLDLAAIARQHGLKEVPQPSQSPKLDLIARARQLGITTDAPAQSPKL